MHVTTRFNFFFRMVLLLSWCKFIQTLLEADYYIQSFEQPLLCVEGSLLDKTLDTNESAHLFHTGKLVGNLCTNRPEQQWHLQGHCNDSRNATCVYNITSSASEEAFLETLYVNVTGFFMKYWSNPIQVISFDKNTVAPYGNLFVLKELRNNSCLQHYGYVVTSRHVTSNCHYR